MWINCWSSAWLSCTRHLVLPRVLPALLPPCRLEIRRSQRDRVLSQTWTYGYWHITQLRWMMKQRFGGLPFQCCLARLRGWWSVVTIYGSTANSNAHFWDRSVVCYEVWRYLPWRDTYLYVRDALRWYSLVARRHDRSFFNRVYSFDFLPSVRPLERTYSD